MTTFVGTQSDFGDALISLIELDMAAARAYEEAITHLEREDYRKALTDFKQDHERHVDELSEVVKKMGKEPPTSGGIKQLFTQGKVMFANLLGDKSILKAMKSNEDDTNEAYEKVNSHRGKIEDAIEVLEAGLADERRHRAWIEKTLRQLEESKEAA